MTLLELTQKFGLLSRTPAPELASRDVQAICFDSRNIESNCVFVAISGSKIDGHLFLEDAIAKGAIGLIVEHLDRVPSDFKGAVLRVPNSRLSLNKLAAIYYGHPAHQLYSVGVTGTNGKTTTTHMIEAIFNYAKIPCGVIGTIDHHLGDRVWKTELTTPGPVAFQERLREFVEAGAGAVALEASSHALDQNRVDEAEFDAAIFTNLTRDHLDYHKTMDEYFAAKQRLFSQLLAQSPKAKRTAVVNGDDPYGQKIPVSTHYSLLRYGKSDHCELKFKILQAGFNGTRFELQTPVGRQEFELKMPGHHNVYNATAAIGAVLGNGLDLETCAAALKTLTGVAGRLQPVENSKGIHVFIDYAHTDDALKTTLDQIRMIRQESGLKSRIVTVFGCGGDRDRGKRPLMMKAALNGSDRVIVTSDNPRTEDPEKIIDDAMAGATRGDELARIRRESDRRKAIAAGLGAATAGDVVLIAGKGHEDYQQIGMIRHPFSDFEVAKELLT